MLGLVLLLALALAPSAADDFVRAVKLYQEALRVAPKPAAAERMLRDDLDYERTSPGWAPRGNFGAAERRRNITEIRVGMTADEVRNLLGRPTRAARQILYRRHLEQWQYDDPPNLLIVFERSRGQEPVVHTIHMPLAAKP